MARHSSVGLKANHARRWCSCKVRVWGGRDDPTPLDTRVVRLRCDAVSFIDRGIKVAYELLMHTPGDCRVEVRQEDALHSVALHLLCSRVLHSAVNLLDDAAVQILKFVRIVIIEVFEDERDEGLFDSGLRQQRTDRGRRGRSSHLPHNGGLEFLVLKSRRGARVRLFAGGFSSGVLATRTR